MNIFSYIKQLKNSHKLVSLSVVKQVTLCHSECQLRLIEELEQ